MADLREWENIISTHINGAPVPAMVDAVRDAAIMFCRDTRLVRQQMAVPIEARFPDIVLPDSDEGMYPGSVIEVFAGEDRITPTDHRELSEQIGTYSGQMVGSIGQVERWFQRRPGTLYLFPRLAVDVPAGLTVDIAYQPKRNAIEVPQFLYEMFAAEIGYGACAILHAHSQAPYAEPQKVVAFGGMFQAAIQQHADRSEAGHAKPRRRTRAYRL